MSSFLKTVAASDHELRTASRPRNPWMIALAVASAALLLAGAITVGIGFTAAGRFDATVLGQNADFDAAVATAIVGGASIVLGVAVGTCALVLAALAWDRRRV